MMMYSSPPEASSGPMSIYAHHTVDAQSWQVCDLRDLPAEAREAVRGALARLDAYLAPLADQGPALPPHMYH